MAEIKEIKVSINGGSSVNKANPDPKVQGPSRRQLERNYEYETVQFPSDLGEGSRHPYSMTFYINIQNLSQWARKGGPSDLVARIGKEGEHTIASTVTKHQRSERVLTKNIGDTNVGFGRKTSRTKAAIRLYIPDTLSWSYQNRFRTPSLSGQRGAAILQAGQAAVDEYQKTGLTGALASLAKSGAAAGVEAAGQAWGGEEAAALALSAFGLAINPQIDVIYDSPELRTFTFEFLMAPRTASEARDIQTIINLFKFHSAPEIIAENSGIGRYFVPPSEFDIKFSVPSMGTISTCVLENLTVDYGTTGAVFYSDESPVATRMTLQFRELEYITKQYVDREVTGRDDEA